MSKEATEFFRKERLALEQEAKRAKEQNKALQQELERVKEVCHTQAEAVNDDTMEGVRALKAYSDYFLTNNQ